MTQPTALRLADALETAEISYTSMVRAAAELRRLHAQRDALLEALKAAEPYLRHADVAYNVYVQARAAIKNAEGGQ
jgi:hypothetical protein